MGWAVRDNARNPLSHTYCVLYSVCYTADGECVLAGGRTKYVCIYAVHPALLLKKFQLSHNRSLDGVLDLLSGRTMTEAGDVAELALSGSDDERTG